MGAGGVSTAGGAGGAGTSGSKPKFGTMTITKVVDNASTTLYQYCSTGDYIPTLNMAVRKSGGDHLLYLQYCFRHNQITTIAWDGGAGDQRPKETLTLEYKAMGMQYVAQDPTGGYTEAPLIWLWSLETGTGNQTLDIGGEPPSEDFLPPIVEPPIVQEDE
jgi:type VI protein secretion system component Hcp